MEIKHDDYYVSYEEETGVLRLEGVINVISEEYKDISSLLNTVLESPTENILLDIKDLTDINSYGITTLARFILSIYKKTQSKLKVIATKKLPWQVKSVENFQHLMPSLEVEWEA